MRVVLWLPSRFGVRCMVFLSVMQISREKMLFALILDLSTQVVHPGNGSYHHYDHSLFHMLTLVSVMLMKLGCLRLLPCCRMPNHTANIRSFEMATISCVLMLFFCVVLYVSMRDPPRPCGWAMPAQPTSDVLRPPPQSLRWQIIAPPPPKPGSSPRRCRPGVGSSTDASLWGRGRSAPCRSNVTLQTTPLSGDFVEASLFKAVATSAQSPN